LARVMALYATCDKKKLRKKIARDTFARLLERSKSLCALNCRFLPRMIIFWHRSTIAR
jgi:hypothetical protein